MQTLIKNLTSIFISLSGESSSVGKRTLFVRFQGCNLRCSYCDTVRSQNCNKKDFEIDILPEINKFITQHNLTNIILTGGEPLLQLSRKELQLIIEKVKAINSDIIVQVETNGSKLIPKFKQKTISFIMDYKLPSSGMEQSMELHNFARLQQKDELKFVVKTMHDLEVVNYILSKYNPICNNIWISPCYGEIGYSTLFKYVRECKHPNVKMQIQLHKIVFPNIKNSEV